MAMGGMAFPGVQPRLRAALEAALGRRRGDATSDRFTSRDPPLDADRTKSGGSDASDTREEELHRPIASAWASGPGNLRPPGGLRYRRR